MSLLLRFMILNINARQGKVQQLQRLLKFKQGRQVELMKCKTLTLLS